MNGRVISWSLLLFLVLECLVECRMETSMMLSDRDGGTRLGARAIDRVDDDGDTRPVGRVIGRVNDDGGTRPCSRVVNRSGEGNYSTRGSSGVVKW